MRWPLKPWVDQSWCSMVRMETTAWSRTDGDEECFEDRYWLTSFPRATNSEDRMLRAVGPEHRMSPILAYDYRECGWVQWVHSEKGVAVLMIADGGWRTGGTLHVWVALGDDHEPLELDLGAPDTLRITPGNFNGWMREMDDAATLVETELHIVTP